METQYKDIIGFDLYRVGSDGSVWSRRPIKRNWKTPLSDWVRLKPVLRRGYQRVGLRFIKGDRLRWRSVHRLVLDAFVGQCPVGCQCCHRDGNKENNHVENLYWGTSKQNAEDSIRLGRIERGSSSHASKLMDHEVRAIRERRLAGVSTRQLGREYRISHTSVSQLVLGKTWSHVK